MGEGEEMITVVCWKWTPENWAKHWDKRKLFSSHHVNVLQAMLERNTTVEHRFIAVCDDWKGLSSTVEVVDINRHFRRFADMGGCYRRLRSFDLVCGLGVFGDRFISLDLDTVIVGNVDHLLGFQDDFRIWSDTHRRLTPYCGSLWGMKAGARQRVWDQFTEDPGKCVRRCKDRRYPGTDQAHISACLYPKEKVWGTEDGVYNFNTQVRKTISCVHRCADGRLDVIQKRDGSLPNGSRVVFFNGKFDPSQPQLQGAYDWIGDYWRE